MNTQQRQLEQRLNDQGWHVLFRECGPDWWANEVWTIESAWRPVGKRLWISFLVDPMGNPYRNDPSVWAVAVTRTLPASNDEATQWTVPIRHCWEASLEKLMDRIAALRDQPVANADSALKRRDQCSHNSAAVFQKVQTKHLYHDATIRAVEFQVEARVSLSVELYGFDNSPEASIHITFDSVRNLAEVRQAFSELAQESSPPDAIATILGIVRDNNGCYVLDLAEGEVALDARGFCET